MNTLFCLAFIAVILATFGGVFITNKDAFYEFAVDRNFNRFEAGTLCLQFSETKDTKRFGKNIEKGHCDAEMIIENKQKFYETIATGGGNIGLGEAYMHGYWSVKKYNNLPANAIESAKVDDTSPLAQVVHHLTANQVRLKQPLFQWLFVNLFNVNQLRHWLERRFTTAKSVEEDKETISYHYDLGNDFFGLYLGDTMSASCAIWNSTTKTLEDAQNNKWGLIIHKLKIDSTHRVLDVGSGWGYFCHRVLTETGASCTGIILSKEQFEYSRNRFSNELCENQGKKPGDAGCIDFQYCDYRDVVKKFGAEYFDRVVSVGMVEHVHILRIQEYYDVLAKVLKNGGLMLIHGITNPDVYPESNPISRKNACQGANFISKYIFPGGCILHVNWMNEAAVKAGLIVMHEEHYGKHYAKTLKQWYDNLARNWPKLKAKGSKYDDIVYRMHEIYFTLCEAAFRVMRVDLTQVVYYKDTKTKFHNDFNWLPKIKNANQA